MTDCNRWRYEGGDVYRCLGCGLLLRVDTPEATVLEPGSDYGAHADAVRRDAEATLATDDALADTWDIWRDE